MKTDMADFVGELEKNHSKEQLEAWTRSHELSRDLIQALMGRSQDLLTVDPRAALRLSEWMISIAFEIQDPTAKALAFRAKGNALHGINDHFQAIQYFDHALKIFDEIGNELELTRTMMNRVVAYYKLSRFDEALADGDRVTAMFRKLGEDRSLAR